MKTNLQKNLLIATLLLILSSGSFAQAYLQDPKYGPDEETRRECAVNLSLYREHYNQRNFDAAKSSWLRVLDICPAASQNAYIHGVRMMKTWIDQERNPNRRSELIDSLLMIYDMRIEHFDRRGILLGQKGMDLVSLDSDRFEEAYGYLKESIEIEKENSDSPVIYTYMVLTNSMYDQNKLSAEEFIETYAKLAEYLDEQLKERPGNPRLTQIKESVDGIFSSAGVADCENLEQLFAPRIKNNPNDLEQIKKTRSLLSANRCENTDFYRDVTMRYFDLEPTARMAHELAGLFNRLRNYEKSVEYLKRAVELEEDPIRKSTYLVEKGIIVFNEFKRLQEARSIALRALQVNEKMGHAYILIGNLYASANDCFSDDFRKNTIYWAAVDKFIRAKQVDPSLESESDRLIEIYSRYFPVQSDIFFQDLQPGQRYTVGCWINETTTVRARP